MSGIAGVVHLDGAPVDRDVLGRLTSFMAFRGPDAQRMWIDGNVGFGHTLLQTTPESQFERQPFAIDDRVWIGADARIDAQSDLVAYRVWGEGCVEHLLGDFTFAVWDGPNRKLFCARDQLGVKPFFYARIGNKLIFSNTADCLLRHPAVSDGLNERAIGDFLLFQLNLDLSSTYFIDIQRLPPAHFGVWSCDQCRIGRYWTLPIDEPLHFKRAEDCVGQFTTLLDTAVRDRLRDNNVAVLMSGGLDSTSLAATACKVLRGETPQAEVHAFTTVMDKIDQNERYYADLVAKHLGIPIHFRDRSKADPDWSETGIHTPEPVMFPTSLAGDRKEFRSIASHSRVLLFGEGPDNALMYEWKPYLSYLAENRKFGRLLGDLSRDFICHRRLPLLSRIPQILKDRSLNWPTPSYPQWFNNDFEARAQLRDRWNDGYSSHQPTQEHPVRPEGYKSFYAPFWEALFAGYDAGATRVPVEVRHPFVDLRLLRFMLAVPALPWCRTKYLERRAMKNQLPAPVLSRPKAAPTSDPIFEMVKHEGLPRLGKAQVLREYVKLPQIPTDAGSCVIQFRTNFRPFALDYWLNNLWQEPIDRPTTGGFKNELVTIA